MFLDQRLDTVSLSLEILQVETPAQLPVCYNSSWAKSFRHTVR